MIAGIILAAGESRRMGSPKALLQMGGETFLERLIAVFRTRCSPVIAVLGHHAPEIRAGIGRSTDAVLLDNPAYRSGQFSSLQVGLRAVPPECGGALFALVDHPNVLPATLDELAAAGPARIAIPRYRGQPGHPVWIASAFIPGFLAIPPDSITREVIRAGETVWVDVNDPGVIQDVDDPETYRRLLRERSQ